MPAACASAAAAPGTPRYGRPARFGIGGCALTSHQTPSNRSMRDLHPTDSQWAARQLLADTDCPTRYEPSGSDFLSPCLAAAELMRRVLRGTAYRVCLHRLLPATALPPLLAPVPASCAGDPQSAHLLGLVFHRAWCLHGIAGHAAAASPAWRAAAWRARRVAEATAAAAFTGGYPVSHWLGTFILYFQSETAT